MGLGNPMITCAGGHGIRGNTVNCVRQGAGMDPELGIWWTLQYVMRGTRVFRHLSKPPVDRGWLEIKNHR
jgi:hypothetical protein